MLVLDLLLACLGKTEPPADTSSSLFSTAPAYWRNLSTGAGDPPVGRKACPGPSARYGLR
jgi:hypothetical protein